MNEEVRPGSWQARFHMPNGKSQTHWTPACERGPMTDVALRKYESAIAVGGLSKAKDAGVEA